jgi:hypothetical protein
MISRTQYFYFKTKSSQQPVWWGIEIITKRKCSKDRLYRQARELHVLQLNSEQRLLVIQTQIIVWHCNPNTQTLQLFSDRIQSI